MQKVKYLLFRVDGVNRVYINKRPPVGQGPIIEVTEEVAKKMAGIPYSKWRFQNGVLSSAENSIELPAVLFKEEDKVPLPLQPAVETSGIIHLLPEKKGSRGRDLFHLAMGVAGGGGLGYLAAQYFFN